MINPLAAADAVRIGNDAGYLLAFHEMEGFTIRSKPSLEIGSDSYHAEIRAGLPGGLEGGTFSFVIEGLIDEHYARLARVEGSKIKVVRLYLFWRDSNASITGYLTNVAGLSDLVSPLKAADLASALVADLRIISVTRKAGARRYETTITARESVFERLNTTYIQKAVPPQSLPQAVEILLKDSCGMQRDRDFKLYDLPAAEKREFAAGRKVRSSLEALATRLEESTGRYGRGMLQVRDGVLHIGPRPIPMAGASSEPAKVTVASGLIETEALEPILTDPGFDASKGKSAPTRRQFRLTLKGRPDLKPGDVVTFDCPPEDVTKTGGGLLGAIGDVLSSALLPSLGDEPFKHPVTLYVASVEHRLGRKTGFVTTITGVEVTGSSQTDFWDKHTPSSSGTQEPSVAAASSESAAASALRNLARAVTGDRLLEEAGEIRQMNNKTSVDAPSQTVTVWRGLAPSDGASNQARRLAINRPSAAPASDVPYLTPFAWGKTGLVLPRYPGTRVLVAHRNGSSDDAIDIGAFWESGKGPDSEPGDYWLILPAGVPGPRRATLEDSSKPEEPTGKATQDLIDADGNRVIEVGELTVRVGRSSLPTAGTRPKRADDADSITIEHSGGAKLVMKSDGSVLIKGKTISIESEGQLSLKGSTVEVE